MSNDSGSANAFIGSPVTVGGLYNTKTEVDSLAQALIKAQDMFA